MHPLPQILAELSAAPWSTRFLATEDINVLSRSMLVISYVAPGSALCPAYIGGAHTVTDVGYLLPGETTVYA
ncbi:unnamed protein product [Somion occarium]|uniref:AraC family transcriptional regulator n=1 Tax=Somion occarium TaxID=3059160 RepID=A0ABP1CZP4_9APHY